MKCEIIIDPQREEKIVIYAKEHRPIIDEIKRLTEGDNIDILGFDGKEMTRLCASDIFCVAVIDGKVYAICEDETFLIKERLYAIEERLPDFFVKINQSCIANINKIERFDASLSGTLRLRFKNGFVDYVSRRQLKLIKERLGI